MHLILTKYRGIITKEFVISTDIYNNVGQNNWNNEQNGFCWMRMESLILGENFAFNAKFFFADYLNLRNK